MSKGRKTGSANKRKPGVNNIWEGGKEKSNKNGQKAGGESVIDNKLTRGTNGPVS